MARLRWQNINFIGVIHFACQRKLNTGVLFAITNTVKYSHTSAGADTSAESGINFNLSNQASTNIPSLQVHIQGYAYIGYLLNLLVCVCVCGLAWLRAIASE